MERAQGLLQCPTCLFVYLSVCTGEEDHKEDKAEGDNSHSLTNRQTGGAEQNGLTKATLGEECADAVPRPPALPWPARDYHLHNQRHVRLQVRELRLYREDMFHTQTVFKFLLCTRSCFTQLQKGISRMAVTQERISHRRGDVKTESEALLLGNDPQSPHCHLKELGVRKLMLGGVNISVEYEPYKPLSGLFFSPCFFIPDHVIVLL